MFFGLWVASSRQEGQEVEHFVQFTDIEHASCIIEVLDNPRSSMFDFWIRFGVANESTVRTTISESVSRSTRPVSTSPSAV